MSMTMAEATERENYIVELIKESGSDGLVATEIDKDFNMPKQRRAVLMCKMLKKHPEIKRLGGHNSTPTYVWQSDKTPAEPEKAHEVVEVNPKYEKKAEPEKAPEPVKPARETHSPFLKNRYEKTNKNNEGYPDMTAKSAISNVNGTANKDWIDPDPGEIWLTEESSGKNSYFFVLSSDSGVVPGIKLYDIKETINPETITRSIRIKLGAVTYIGDCARITYKPKKYLVRRARAFQPDEIGKVRKEVADALGIIFFRTEKVEVPGPERIVTERVEVPGPERIVYKPLEVPEGCVDAKDAKISALEEQVKIWKSAFWGLVHSNNDTSAKNS